VVTVLIWSFHFPVIKYALSNGFTPFAYAALRFGIGAMLFAGLTYRREGTIRVERRHLPLLAGVFGLCLYLNQITLASSIRLTNASTVALVMGTLPIFVGMLAWMTRIERPYTRQWLAIGVSFAGVALVAGDAQGGLTGDLGGILLALVPSITFAVYTTFLGPMLRQYSPYRISTVVGLAATVPLLATGIPQLGSEDWADISKLAWAAFAYGLLLSFLLTNILWFKALDRVGPNRAALYANLQPFLGAAFAVLVLGETMGSLQILGGIVIAAAIVLAKPRRAPVELVD
jgi:drug/metabolite transporter (DMT)-like permease